MSERNIVTDEPDDFPPSADRAVASLRLRLRHQSLSQLEENGFVEWDRDENIVTKGPQFDETKPELTVDY